MIIRKAFFEFEGKKIGGYFYVPGEGKYPLAIVVHGFGGGTFERGKSALCVDLARRGIASFFFDFYSHHYGLTEFSIEDMTVSFQVKVLAAVHDFVCSQEFVKTKKIAIVGHSLGGLTGYLYCASSDRIAALCVLAAVSDLNWDLEHCFGPLDDWHVNGIKQFGDEWGGMSVKWDFVIDARSHDVMSVLPTITCPTCIVHGDADSVVPLEQAKAQHAAIIGSTLNVLRGVDHDFNGEGYNLMREAVGDFLCDVLILEKKVTISKYADDEQSKEEE